MIKFIENSFLQNQHDLNTIQPIDPNAILFEAPRFESSKRVDKVLQIRISRNTSIALLISLLVHLLLFITIAPKLFPAGKPITTTQPLTISLNAPSKATAPPQPSPAPVPAPSPVPIKPSVKKSRVKSTKPTPSPHVITATKPTPKANPDSFRVPPIIIPKNLPKPTPEAAPEPLPGEDMQAYIKRQKEYQQHKQGYTSRDIADANPDNGSSEDSRRNRAIAENMKFGDSNGIFEIKSMGLHSAEFSFKGWKNNNVSRAISENINVNVPDGEDIKLAIIRKMITIIRREYSGDFNWESRRLDRVVVQSARLADTSGLESFLMLEFFGPGGAYRQ